MIWREIKYNLITFYHNNDSTNKIKKFQNEEMIRVEWLKEQY